MAFIGIQLQHDVARLFRDLNVPGIHEDTASLHITLFYLGADLNIDQLAKTMTNAFKITQQTKPFLIKTKEINCFDVPEGKKIPIIASVISAELLILRKTMKKIFDKEHIYYDTTFKDYQPHITLSFNDEKIKKTKISPIEFISQDIVIWGGNHGDDKIAITLPFSLKENEEIAKKCCLNK